MFQVVLCLLAWIITRTLTIDQFYFQVHGQISYEDLNVFVRWAHDVVQTHQAPVEDAWQYPPGAIYVFLLPLAFPWPVFPSFIGMLLATDLLITLALLSLGWRNNKFAGSWVWVLVLPALGKLPLLRFDTIPTAFAVISLTLPELRWKNEIFGVIMGLGTAVKAWPAVVFLAASEKRDAKIIIFTSVLTFLLIAAGTQYWCSGSLSFLQNQIGRGLEIEAVAATPWYVLQAVSGYHVTWAAGHGSLEIVGIWPARVAEFLHVTMLVLGCACAIWWFLWTRRSAAAKPEIKSAIGRDAAFTAILLYVVVSPVLSPQYLIWLIGLGAVAASSPHSVVRRPVWAVVVAALLSQALLPVWGDLVSDGPTGAYFLAERNLVLLFGGLDAAIALFKVLKMPALLKETIALPQAAPGLPFA